MISITEKSLLIFFVTINYFMIGFGTDVSEFKFHVEWIPEKTIVEVEKRRNHPDLETKPLHKMLPAIRRAMCVAAKHHASLDGMSPNDDIFPANGYIFTFPDGSTKELVAMRCSTIPASHLYFTHAPNEVTLTYKLLRQAQDELTIVMKENQFLTDDYQFLLQIIESDPVPQPEDFIRTGPLSKGEKLLLQPTTNFLDLCIAATKRIKYGRSPVIMLSNTIRDKQDWYEFDYSNEDTLNHENNQDLYTFYTVVCPSSPTMYLYLTSIPEFLFRIHVVIVEKKKDPKLKQ